MRVWGKQKPLPHFATSQLYSTSMPCLRQWAVSIPQKSRLSFAGQTNKKKTQAKCIHIRIFMLFVCVTWEQLLKKEFGVMFIRP